MSKGSNKRNNHLARQSQALAQSLSVTTSTTWNHPVLPPDMLEKYRQLDPMFPQKFFDQWDLEAAHRRTIETELVKQQGVQIQTERDISLAATDAKKANQYLGFFLAFFLIGSSLYLAISGKEWPALGSFGMTIAYIFYGRHQKNKEEN